MTFNNYLKIGVCIIAKNMSMNRSDKHCFYNCSRYIIQCTCKIAVGVMI